MYGAEPRKQLLRIREKLVSPCDKSLQILQGKWEWGSHPMGGGSRKQQRTPRVYKQSREVWRRGSAESTEQELEEELIQRLCAGGGPGGRQEGSNNGCIIEIILPDITVTKRGEKKEIGT